MKFSKEIIIGSERISNHSRVFIIAEAGVNHNGDLSSAKTLVDAAHEAGADAVKFQAFRTEHLILDQVEKAPYQQLTTGQSETQYQMLKKLELSTSYYHELKSYCDEKGITFLITPFDETSLDELDALNLTAYKVASTDLTNLPFLRRIASKGKPIILSTGMSYLSEIEHVLEKIAPINPKIILLQCVANYPISDEEANLAVLHTFQHRFGILTGYSDHSVGLGVGPYAVPLGARVIEKHFTLSRTLDGPDQEASLEPDELKAFVQEIRRVERMLGPGIKSVTLAETRTRASLQKCLVARKPIGQGEPFTEDNLVAKRTGGLGISPLFIDDLLGQIADRDYRTDEIITLL